MRSLLLILGEGHFMALKPQQEVSTLLLHCIATVCLCALLPVFDGAVTDRLLWCTLSLALILAT